MVSPGHVGYPEPLVTKRGQHALFNNSNSLHFCGGIKKMFVIVLWS